MQTFLPYENFHKSAESLDMKRLGKQRVEVLQLLNSIKAIKEDRPYRGWKNHPCREMWHNYANALVDYGIAVCEVWRARGYKDTCLEKISAHFNDRESDKRPEWLGRKDIHLSHKSMLVQKKPDHYKKMWPSVPDNLEYVWPTRVTAKDVIHAEIKK